MTKKQQKELKLIIFCFLLFVITMLIPINSIIKKFLYIIVCLAVGHQVFWKALKNIKNGQIFDENFLMSIAAIGAFLIGESPEGTAVILFYKIGELFEHVAVGKSRKSITDLMNICPEFANVERNGQIEETEPEEIAIGETIIIKAGEKIPLDGIVIDGSSTLDTSALTGESLPRSVNPEDSVLSGSINLTGVLKVKVTKEFAESTVSKILDLVENASNKKAHSEQFITKFAKYYTPFVVITAFLLAFIPPLIMSNHDFTQWIHRGLIFLVISCPCALVISVPLSFFGGIGGCSKIGILVKGSNYLEALSHAETVVMDKTGTLTKGIFEVSSIVPQFIGKEKLLEYCVYAEYYSNHPISLSLKKAYDKPIFPEKLSDVKEISGQGVYAMLETELIHAGNESLMNSIGLTVPPNPSNGTIIYIAINKKYAGYITIEDQIKDDAKKAISNLKNLGVKKIVMLTGDHKKTADKIASSLKLDIVKSELLPIDKVNEVEELIRNTSSKGTLVFAGDGINDAPVLTRADIGIAMGGLGSDAAIEAADIVIMTDEPGKIASAIAISRKTVGIVKQNIIFALGVKFFILALGAFGYANMWEAVFADVGVSVIAIINASRTLRYRGQLS